MEQFIKFGIVGFSNTVISYLVYAILLQLNLHYLLSSVLSFIVGVLNSFYWNNKYVFKHNKKVRVWWKTLIKTFASYSITGLFLSNALLILWVENFNLSEIIAPVINLCITVPANFFLNKYWAFRNKDNQSS